VSVSITGLHMWLGRMMGTWFFATLTFSTQCIWWQDHGDRTGWARSRALVRWRSGATTAALADVLWRLLGASVLAVRVPDRLGRQSLDRHLALLLVGGRRRLLQLHERERQVQVKGAVGGIVDMRRRNNDNNLRQKLACLPLKLWFLTFVRLDHKNPRKELWHF